MTKAFFDTVVSGALTKGQCSEHFYVDGTLIESLASAKSFQPKEAQAYAGAHAGGGFKPRNLEVDFHGQNRSKETHVSPTDPEAKLYRKSPGQEAKMSHMGHVLNENRNGLILSITATEANVTAERTAAYQSWAFAATILGRGNCGPLAAHPLRALDDPTWATMARTPDGRNLSGLSFYTTSVTSFNADCRVA